jgi:pullulanase/glycogen debranching enzyme
MGRSRALPTLRGSSDLYGSDWRPPASVNLITVHAGFTLTDLVLHAFTHTEAISDGNRARALFRASLANCTSNISNQTGQRTVLLPLYKSRARAVAK